MQYIGEWIWLIDGEEKRFFMKKIETFDLLWLVDSLQYCIIYASYKNHMFLWLEYNEEVAVQQKANACVRIYFYAH